MTIFEAEETQYGMFPFNEQHASSITEADNKITRILNKYITDGYEIIENYFLPGYTMIGDNGKAYRLYITVP